MADMNKSINLPVELIEAILSKSPYKSIVRFKSVCKQWHDIISEPRFFRFHHALRTSKPSEKPNLFVAWMKGKEQTLICLMKLEDGKLTTVSSKKDPCSHIFGSSCKGLFLLSGIYGPRPSYMLWNPSIQKSTMINMPLVPAHYRFPHDCHLYHDEGIDDYKIVFVYEEHYTVYSCKNRSWGKMLHFPKYEKCLNTIAFVDGCLYRLCKGGVSTFNFRDGKSSELIQLPKDVVEVQGKKDFSGLGVLSGSLYLWSYTKGEMKRFRLWVMENYGSFKENCWRKLIDNDKGEEDWGRCRPLSLSNEDSTVVIHSAYNLLIYNAHEQGFQKIDSDLYDIFQYEKNLYMPS